MFVETRIYERMEKLIRQPGSAGKQYSNQKGILEREVAVLLESAKSINIPNKVYGMIVPNDSHLKSGGVAARAYRHLIDEDIDTVIIITHSRLTYFEEISIFKGDAYSTPLGQVKLDKDLVWQITNAHEKIIESTLGHETEEHGIEVQLPFLQQVLYDFKIVPIVMGNQDTENIVILTDVLSNALKGKNVLIIASSNLSENHSYDKATTIDDVSMSHIKKYDSKSLNKEYQDGTVELTDGGAVVTTMNVCKNLGATKSNVLLYRNSGDMGASKQKVVGYFAALFYS